MHFSCSAQKPVLFLFFLSSEISALPGASSGFAPTASDTSGSSASGTTPYGNEPFKLSQKFTTTKIAFSDMIGSPTGLFQIGSPTGFPRIGSSTGLAQIGFSTGLPQIGSSTELAQSSESARLLKKNKISNQSYAKRTPLFDVTVQSSDYGTVPIELKAISQSPAQRKLSKVKDYRYRSEAGEDTVVYVIDSGVNNDHVEFRECKIVDFDQWLKPEDWNEPSKRPSYNDYHGHGTWVTSKICGQITGVAKKTTIIPVIDTLGHEWQSIRLDIERRRRENPPTATAGKTIVNYAQEVTHFRSGVSIHTSNSAEAEEKRTVLAEIKKLIDLDVVVVVSAGKTEEETHWDQTIDGLPALWAERDFPIIVASGLTQNFQKAQWSKYGPQTTTWAIGEEVVVACHEKRGEVMFKSGNSYVVPQVSGLVAYYLSLPTGGPKIRDQNGEIKKGQVAKIVYDWFRTGPGAYAREPNGPRVIYNGCPR